ncbi:MAG: hypothetical protein QM589_00985 [Thermomicrobiales bacterium]
MGRSVREFKENVDPDLTPSPRSAPNDPHAASIGALPPEERLALQERMTTSAEGIHAVDV